MSDQHDDALCDFLGDDGEIHNNVGPEFPDPSPVFLILAVFVVALILVVSWIFSPRR